MAGNETIIMVNQNGKEREHEMEAVAYFWGWFRDTKRNEQIEATIVGGYQGYYSDPFHRSLLGTFQFGCGIH